MLLGWNAGRGSQYHDFVWHAVTNERAFRSFRRNRHYRRILEHVSEERGAEYLTLVTNPVVRELCLASEYADSIGTPRVALYEGKRLSPTTLRYAKVLCDLTTFFPRLSGCKSMVEVGVGYGGQARLVCEFAARTGAALESYTLVDLLPVVHLARLYLEHFSLKPSFAYQTKSTLPKTGSFDLAVSNYAFSEFHRTLQEEYLETVFTKATSGYLTMNSGRTPGAGWRGAPCFAAAELVKILPNAVLRRNEPMTAPGNYIIVYGDHNTQSNL